MRKMEEKDRHIITFDMGPEDEPTPKAEAEAPKVERSRTSYSLRVSPRLRRKDEGLDFILKPSTPEAKVETPSFEMKASEPKVEKDHGDYRYEAYAGGYVSGRGFGLHHEPESD